MRKINPCNFFNIAYYSCKFFRQDIEKFVIKIVNNVRCL